MPKWNCSYDSSRKYKAEWEKTFMWVKSAPDGSGEAYCKLCHCNLKPKMCSLQNHGKSEKHKKKTVSPALAPPLGSLQPVQGDSTKAYCKFCGTTTQAHIKSLVGHSDNKKHKECLSANSSREQPPITDSIHPHVQDPTGVNEVNISYNLPLVYTEQTSQLPDDSIVINAEPSEFEEKVLYHISSTSSNKRNQESSDHSCTPATTYTGQKSWQVSSRNEEEPSPTTSCKKKRVARELILGNKVTTAEEALSILKSTVNKSQKEDIPYVAGVFVREMFSDFPRERHVALMMKLSVFLDKLKSEEVELKAFNEINGKL